MSSHTHTNVPTKYMKNVIQTNKKIKTGEERDEREEDDKLKPYQCT